MAQRSRELLAETMKSVIWAVAAAALVTSMAEDSAVANEPGWSPVIVARGEYRDQIQSLPVEQRPYRPLHIYGNTVRRLHYHGTPAPSLRELVTPILIQRSRLDAW